MSCRRLTFGLLSCLLLATTCGAHPNKTVHTRRWTADAMLRLFHHYDHKETTYPAVQFSWDGADRCHPIDHCKFTNQEHGWRSALIWLPSKAWCMCFSEHSDCTGRTVCFKGPLAWPTHFDWDFGTENYDIRAVSIRTDHCPKSVHVPDRRPTYYANDTACTPCHPACYDYGCTGPEPILGPGGCNHCRFAKLFDNDTESGTIEHCLVGTSQSTVCTENDLDSYFLRPATGNETERVEDGICVSCSPECLTCTGQGVETRDNSVRCQCRSYTLLEVSGKFPETCALSCDGPDRYLIGHQNYSTPYPWKCGRCDETCKGCHGPSEMDCKQCRIAEISQPNGTRRCATKCPSDEPFGPYEDKRCSKEDRDALRSRRAKLALSIFALIVIAVLIGAIIYRCNRCRRGLETERRFNEPVLPSLKPVDPNAMPNMNRLILIPAEQLAHKASRPLGRGAFNAVYAGIWMPEGRGGPRVPVAIKIVKGLSPQAQQDILDEAIKMAMLQHQHLLRLVGVCLAGDYIQMVTQLRPLGDLLNFLRKNRQSLAGRDLLIYCYQIALAMEYLFQQRLVHRDLAARNVLVKSVNHVEVTDFGLAKLLDYNEESAHVDGPTAPKWLALECFSTKSYNHQTDVWAFGVTCWEILTYGTAPYSQLPNADDLESLLEAGHRLEQPNNCSTDVYGTLLQCWVAEPQSRPDFVRLREQFEKYCSAPNLFVTDKHSTMRMESYSLDVQRGLAMDLLDGQQSEGVDLNHFDNRESSLGRQPHPVGGHHTLFSQRSVTRQSHHVQRFSWTQLLARTRTSPFSSSSSAGRSNVETNDLTPPRRVEISLNGDTELVSSHDYCNMAEASSPKRTEQEPAITRQDTIQAQDAESAV